jgi:hypothetical protein
VPVMISISSGGLDVERALEGADFFGFPSGGTEEGRLGLVFNSLCISDLVATIGSRLKGCSVRKVKLHAQTLCKCLHVTGSIKAPPTAANGLVTVTITLRQKRRPWVTFASPITVRGMVSRHMKYHLTFSYQMLSYTSRLWTCDPCLRVNLPSLRS